MQAIDTNILVRIATRDNEAQFKKATKLIRNRFSSESPAWISCIVLTELTWVLASTYKYSRDQISSFIKTVSEADVFLLEDSSSVAKAITFFHASKADFSDCLILARNLSNRISPTHTFDRKAAKLEGFQLLK